MNIGIFTFGVFVTVLLVIGFIFTMNEFKKMGENPGDYESKEAYKNKR
jgi:heme/copper-type cytochrome/quinol oxidase subunit 4